MSRLFSGTLIPTTQWRDIHHRRVDIPDAQRWTHLQFRRFSGCPLCNLHLRRFFERSGELQNNSVQKVVVFHSQQEHLLQDFPDTPFAIIADPRKRLYHEFGVETSPLSILNPASWWPAVKGLSHSGITLPRKGESLMGLPADFLIDSHGRLAAVHYGRHAYDQWTLDELLQQVKELRR